MICPMKFTKASDADGLLRQDAAPCERDECAWWNSHTEECMTISIGRVLNHMSDYIYKMLEKMPHEKQFRK